MDGFVCKASRDLLRDFGPGEALERWCKGDPVGLVGRPIKLPLGAAVSVVRPSLPGREILNLKVIKIAASGAHVLCIFEDGELSTYRQLQLVRGGAIDHVTRGGRKVRVLLSGDGLRCSAAVEE
jgi:hypothetical protein